MRALILLLCATQLAGCGTLEKALRSAARDKGAAQARVTLPALPEDCRRHEAHAPLVAGAELRSALKRERASVDRGNARIDRCAEHYDGLKARLQ
jgi:hypothetical protein